MALKEIFLLALGLVLLFGCTGPAEEIPETGEEMNETEETTVSEPTEEIAVFETSKGTFEITLNREKSPITVENFVTYVNSGFYDGTIFHRVIPSFMIQGGGFTNDATEKETNAPIVIESNNGLKNVKGAVAMARTMDPNSATSQFFVNTVDNAFLDYTPTNPGYTVFGEVTSGMEVVMEIEGVQTANRGQHQDWPVEDIVITKAYMKK